MPHLGLGYLKIGQPHINNPKPDISHLHKTLWAGISKLIILNYEGINKLIIRLVQALSWYNYYRTWRLAILNGILTVSGCYYTKSKHKLGWVSMHVHWQAGAESWVSGKKSRAFLPTNHRPPGYMLNMDCPAHYLFPSLFPHVYTPLPLPYIIQILDAL